MDTDAVGVVVFVCLYPRHGVADAVAAAAVDVAPSTWLLLLLSLCLLWLLLLLLSLPRHGYTLVMALRVCWCWRSNAFLLFSVAFLSIYICNTIAFCL